eukprot:TRINITY_DN689_c0_g1_i1.p1 TRINITY_DN689_c0_g1~~TRINITY_DN689_c0_g1_i1.p1  ORF type:complete len:294 (+),score=55.57 TRINITY_DN689_c0_g1_i1:52-882(+)
MEALLEVKDTIGSTIDDYWVILYENFTPFQLQVYGSFFVVFIMLYWPICLLFMFLDLKRSPKFLYNFKIQKEKHQTWELYKKAMKTGLINQFLVSLPFAFVFYYLCEGINERFGTSFGYSVTRELPSLYIVIRDFLFFFLVEEIGFFYGHYLFHMDPFYKYIHKFHHQFKAPLAFTCIYAHPIEHIVSNLLPLMLGPALMGSHILQVYLWHGMAIVNTMHSHSGFNLPFLGDATEHDLHHEAFKYNFGVFGIFDRLHKTNLSREDYLKQKEQRKNK